MAEYSYKLNNSYTVYVSRESTQCANPPTTRLSSKARNIPRKKKLVERTLLRPLPVHTRFQHKQYGAGDLVGTDEYGYMTIVFAQKKARFVYPDAINKGFLVKL